MTVWNLFNITLDEGTLAFSDHIVGLFDEELEVEPDEEVEALLADVDL